MATEIRTKAVVVDTSQSPYAKLRPVAVSDVRLSDPIWEPRRRLTTERTIPVQHALLESSQRLDNLRQHQLATLNDAIRSANVPVIGIA